MSAGARSYFLIDVLKPFHCRLNYMTAVKYHSNIKLFFPLAAWFCRHYSMFRINSHSQAIGITGYKPNSGLLLSNQHSLHISELRQGHTTSAHLQNHADWPGSSTSCSTFNRMWENWVIVGKHDLSVSLLPNAGKPEVTHNNSVCLGNGKTAWFISKVCNEAVVVPHCLPTFVKFLPWSVPDLGIPAVNRYFCFKQTTWEIIKVVSVSWLFYFGKHFSLLFITNCSVCKVTLTSSFLMKVAMS